MLSGPSPFSDSVIDSGTLTCDDGSTVAWTAVGDGRPVVLCNGVGVSTFFWRYLVGHLQGRFRVVTWDYPGHGVADPPTDPERADLSIPRLAHELDRVRVAAGAAEPAVLVGHSMGVQVILEAWHQRPGSVAGLVPMFGTAGRPLDTFLAGASSRRALSWLQRMSRWAGPRSSRLIRAATASPLAIPFGRRTGLVDRYYAPTEDVAMYLQHFERLDPKVFLRMVTQMADHDLRHRLHEIAVPTLVFGAERDLFTPLACSLDMHRAIAGAELMVLPEGSHAALVEQTETIHRRLDRFLTKVWS